MSQQSNQQVESVEAMDFLMPEQRSRAIAEIMATIVLRILKEDYEQDQNL